MALCNITIPPAATFIPVDTRTDNLKVILLPSVTDYPGRFLTIKDQYGTSMTSSFVLSTTVTGNLIEGTSNRFQFSANSSAISLISDGLTSWRALDWYVTPPPIRFYPAFLPGGFLWLDASIVSGADGATITTWPSAWPAFTYTMIGSCTLKTGILNGLKVLQLATSQNLATTPSMGTTINTFTMFCVSRHTGGTNRRIWQGANGNILYGYWGGYKNVLFMEGWVTSQTSAADTSWDIYTITRTSGGLASILRTGTPIVTSGGGSTAGINTGIAVNTGGTGGETSDCQLAELLLYNGVLTDDQCRQMEGYLAWKWDLRSDLPETHPYKNAAPT